MINDVLGAFCLGVLFPAYVAFMGWILVQCVQADRKLRQDYRQQMKPGGEVRG